MAEIRDEGRPRVLNVVAAAMRVDDGFSILVSSNVLRQSLLLTGRSLLRGGDGAEPCC